MRAGPLHEKLAHVGYIKNTGGVARGRVFHIQSFVLYGHGVAGKGNRFASRATWTWFNTSSFIDEYCAANVTKVYGMPKAT